MLNPFMAGFCLGLLGTIALAQSARAAGSYQDLVPRDRSPAFQFDCEGLKRTKQSLDGLTGRESMKDPRVQEAQKVFAEIFYQVSRLESESQKAYLSQVQQCIGSVGQEISATCKPAQGGLSASNPEFSANPSLLSPKLESKIIGAGIGTEVAIIGGTVAEVATTNAWINLYPSASTLGEIGAGGSIAVGGAVVAALGAAVAGYMVGTMIFTVYEQPIVNATLDAYNTVSRIPLIRDIAPQVPLDGEMKQGDANIKAAHLTAAILDHKRSQSAALSQPTAECNSAANQLATRSQKGHAALEIPQAPASESLLAQ